MKTWEIILLGITIFVLVMGLFTIGSMVVNLIKGRKSGVPKNQNPPMPPLHPLLKRWHNLTPQELNLIDEQRRLERTICEYYRMPKHLLFEYERAIYGFSLQDQLREAIDREDYEEAARVRDLINKGNEIS